MAKRKPKEEWADIPGYEGLYRISTYGRIIAKPRKRTYVDKDGNEKVRYYEHRFIEPKSDKNEYKHVSLCDAQENSKRFPIHRLVAMAFVPNPDNLPIVNHKDENKSNNHADNLEWCTNEYNITYGTAVARRIATYKANSPARALARAEKKAEARIKEKGMIVVDVSCGPTIGTFRTIEEAKQKLGIKVKSNRTIEDCLNGEEYSAYGYCWYYEKDLEFNP